MPKSESTHIPKKDLKLFCFAGVMSCVLWALEKNPWTIIICLTAMALFLFVPVWDLPWARDKRARRWVALLLAYLAICAFGWSVWPKSRLHGSIARRLTELLVEPFYPYHPGTAKMNVYYKNVGTAQVRNVKTSGKVELVQASANEDELFSEFKSKASFSPVENDLPPNSPEFFITIRSSRILTEQDVNLLNGPVPMMKMCAVSAILWEDDTGQYESDLCGCMEPQRHPGAIPPFAFSRGHNGEWRTR
jgi:hypothetical protein